MNSNNSSKSSAYVYFSANTFILVVTIVLCFYIIVYFYKQMSAAKSNQLSDIALARVTAVCPDYWDITAPNICSNSKKLGMCRLGETDNGSVDFNDQVFSDPKTGTFMKCQWAKTCGVSWQGIDNQC